jgi:hypothetical protein
LPAAESPAAEKFACQDRFHFDASVRKRWTVLVINGVSQEVPNKTFALLLRMAVQLREDGRGWVRGDEFGENAHQAVSNARKVIQRFLANPKTDILENDGFGSYRLSVPLENVSFDWEKIREHWDGQISPLAKFAPKEPAGAAS